MRIKPAITVLTLLLVGVPFANAVNRGALLRVGTIYVAPDAASARLADVDRGREIVVLQTSRDWIDVEAQLTQDRVVTGWILGKGVVMDSTPDGDKVLFGEAVDSEDQASQRHGRNGAAQDAMRLYYEVSQLFPASPLAGEAMYRSADIHWQIEKADVMSRPSAHEKEAYLREGMNEDYFDEVRKKFKGTKWADLAAFHEIDNKLCGEWQGASKCPDKEADMYEKYAKEHPDSPAIAEALYDAAWRRSALIEIYKTEGDPKKSAESRTRALALAERAAQVPQTDWATRAQRLIFLIQQGVPTYGNAEE